MKPPPLFHSTKLCSSDASVGLIQHSIVNPPPLPTSKLADPGTCNAVPAPLKAKARPTSPAVNWVPLTNFAALVPAESYPLPSPRHKLTRPVGAGTQWLAHFPAPPAL